MKKLLVVAKNPETYFIKRLIEEVGQSHIQLFNPWKDDLPRDFHSVLFRSFGVYHSEVDMDFVKKVSAPVLNPVSSLINFRSKSSQYHFFSRYNHSSLPWCWLQNWNEDAGEFLVKPNFGQGGWGIQVFSPAELKQFRVQMHFKNDMDWLVQPYIKAPEYRVFFLGSERMVLKRLPAMEKAAANFSQAGSAEMVKMPGHFEIPVEALIKDSGAFYGAIDILDPPSGLVFLELNVVPGIEQLEKVSRLNIMKKLTSANFFCHIA